MRKILLICMILLSLKSYSQDCKVCTYSRFLWFDRARNVEFNESCPSTIFICFFRCYRFRLTNVDDSGCSILPIELTSFTASLNKYKIDFEWITQSELNNAYFTLYESLDGYDWYSVAKVDGVGTIHSEVIYNYELTDLPNTQLVYYKLRQTDYNGDWEEFEPIYVDLSKLFIINKELIGIFTSLGQKLNSDKYYKGVIIYKWSDGTITRKLKI